MVGSGDLNRYPQPYMATDIASVRPLRSASSDNNAVPTCDTRFFPSVVTLIDWVARLSCTFKEPSWFCEMCCVETHILPGQGGFYMDADIIDSGARQIFEVREVFDLETSVRDLHLAEMAEVAAAANEVFKPLKMNIESLGNGVPHLHWWITPRYQTDPRPTGPIWEDLDFLRTHWGSGGGC